MNWREIKSFLYFLFIFILAIELIEYQAPTSLVEMAGDIFGAFGLMFLGAKEILDNEN